MKGTARRRDTGRSDICDDVNMVVPQGPLPRQCVSTLIMAHTPLKSFTINSILPETAIDARSGSPEPEEECDLKRETSSDAEVSDCESDLDVTGTTPPLDCSNKGAEGENDKEGKDLFRISKNIHNKVSAMVILMCG